MKKTVLMPIKVPAGIFCWKCTEPEICEHFDNEGGHPSCDLGFYPQERTQEGYVLKPKKCADLPYAPQEDE